jgi:hypothetical protein
MDGSNFPMSEDNLKKRNSGFGVGLVVGSIIVFVHITFILINDYRTSADLFIWIFQLISYYIAGYVSAKRQFENNIDDIDVGEHIPGAARGAALIISLLVWLYIIIRSLLINDAGMFFGFGILGSMGFLILDVMIALGLGSIAGKQVLKHQIG